MRESRGAEHVFLISDATDIPPGKVFGLKQYKEGRREGQRGQGMTMGHGAPKSENKCSLGKVHYLALTFRLKS